MAAAIEAKRSAVGSGGGNPYRNKTLDEIDPIRTTTFTFFTAAAAPTAGGDQKATDSASPQSVTIECRRPVQPLTKWYTTSGGAAAAKSDPALDMAIVNLLGSLGTSTDYTGDRVWDANVCLCAYLISLITRGSSGSTSSTGAAGVDEWAKYRVLELGAGTGLASVLMSRFVRSVHATDGNTKTLTLLQRNLHTKTDSGGGRGGGSDSKTPQPVNTPTSGLLFWGDQTQIKTALATLQQPTDSAGSTAAAAGAGGGERFDIIIGADLVYSDVSHSPITPLLETVALTLRVAPHARMWWCHMLRPYSGVLPAIQSAASQAGLTVTVHEDVATRLGLSASSGGGSSSSSAVPPKSCLSQLKQMRMLEIAWTQFIPPPPPTTNAAGTTTTTTATAGAAKS